MLNRLPSWIWFGAWVLAFVAGMVNVLGFLGFEHQMLTHMTGLTSQLGVAINEGDGVGVFRIVSVMVAFLSGAFVSGLLIQNDEFHWGARYGLALFLETIVLAVAYALLRRESNFGFYLASFACGLQNAMVATFSGSVIRTTHVSGMFTDLGVALGHRLRKLPVDRRRIRICVSTITGFFAGGMLCAVLYPHFGKACLLIPAMITATLSTTFLRLRKRYAKRD
ncbi:MAG: YoaK family protein [Pirellulales bacterium]